eukprot:TRINITY_DN43387_c0_g1_i1.p1 TRINITY_DN43387_c0_g1~~TRINITY_DN43387_c0_g1_i1.p1  ORF type:complete len:556 (-),score=99.96 TRINITY_DN43387_c0_g1_i1:58-1524(-)
MAGSSQLELLSQVEVDTANLGISSLSFNATAPCIMKGALARTSSITLMDLDALKEVSAPLQDRFDLLYTVTAQFGTPPVDARLVVDTGSSDIWLKASPPSVAAAQYSLSSSRTASKLPGTIELSYGVGSVAGQEVQDRICLAGVCAEHQNFIMAAGIRGIADMSFFDGLLGLGFAALAKDKAGKTFLETLSHQGPFRQLGFSLAIRGETAQSFLAFGELSALLAEAVEGKSGLGSGGAATAAVTLPVWGLQHQAAYWLVQMRVFVSRHSGSAVAELVGQEPPMLDIERVFGVLDSGTSLIAVPRPIYLPILAALFEGHEIQDTCSIMLPGAVGQMVCLCPKTKLNSLQFIFNGFEGRDLEIEISHDDLVVPVGRTSQGRALCRVSMMPSPSSMPFVILGDVFLRKVTAIHDPGRLLVTLVPEKGHGIVRQSGVVVNQDLEHSFSAHVAQANYAAVTGAVIAVLVILVLYGVFPRRSVQEPAEQAYLRL